MKLKYRGRQYLEEHDRDQASEDIIEYVEEKCQRGSAVLRARYKGCPVLFVGIPSWRRFPSKLWGNYDAEMEIDQETQEALYDRFLRANSISNVVVRNYETPLKLEDL